MFALTAHAYLWTKACEVAYTKQASNEKAFYESKIETARFFMQKILPQTSSLFACIMAGSKPLMEIKMEEHTSELQSLMRISYAVFCLKKKINHTTKIYLHTSI